MKPRSPENKTSNQTTTSTASTGSLPNSTSNNQNPFFSYSFSNPKNPVQMCFERFARNAYLGKNYPGTPTPPSINDERIDCSNILANFYDNEMQQKRNALQTKPLEQAKSTHFKPRV